MVKKKIAFADFDGTLSKDYISMAFLDYLHANGLYSKDKYASQMQLVQDYKKKKVSYDKWVFRWAELWAAGLQGQPKKKIDRAAKELFENFKSKINPASYELMHKLKEQGYYLTLISVGAFEMIELASKELGMNDAIATKCEIKNSIYTGKLTTQIHRPAGKAELLERYIKNNNFTLKDSFAFGDSSHDISMLELVEHPIAVNPDSKLESIAKNKDWPIYTFKNVLDSIKNL